jgi:hypothetical protein
MGSFLLVNKPKTESEFLMQVQLPFVPNALASRNGGTA